MGVIIILFKREHKEFILITHHNYATPNLIEEFLTKLPPTFTHIHAMQYISYIYILHTIHTLQKICETGGKLVYHRDCSCSFILIIIAFII